MLPFEPKPTRKTMKNDDLKKERLVPLSAMHDYKVAKDNPDVVGWRLLGADGETLGMVKDLIVDPQAMKARYLSVLADRRFFNADRDQFMLVPIGAAALDKKAKKVFVSSIDASSISRYPVYGGGPIPADYEYAVRDTFRQTQRDALADSTDTTTSPAISDDFYNTDTYNEDRFYTSNQEVDRDKTVTTYAPEVAASPAGTVEQGRKYEGEGRKYASVADIIVTLEKLESLREKGSITEEEFRLLKKRALDF
jgi:hypothetical protein